MRFQSFKNSCFKFASNFDIRISNLSVLGILVLSTAALAADVTVVTLEGDEKGGGLNGLNETEVKIGDASIPLKNIAEISIGARSAPAASTTLYLRNGDVIRNVKIVSGDDTKLKFSSDAFGEQSLDNKYIRAITFAIKDGPSADAIETFVSAAPPKEDLLMMPKGDTVSGFFEKFTDKDVSFNAGGQSRAYSFEQVAAFRLAPLEELKAREGFLATIELREGSTVTGKLTGVAEDALKFEILNGQAVSVKTDALSSIKFKGGKLVYLSDLSPSAVEEKPYVGGAPMVYRWRKDKSAAAGKIALGSKEYARGIGVHSFSKLTYELNSSYEKFFCDVGIDALVSSGECSWRVMVDGREAAAGSAKAGDKLQVLKIDVKAARQLELICDFGADENDAGDHLNWANARLIKP
jgi:hypothetical protein